MIPYFVVNYALYKNYFTEKDGILMNNGAWAKMKKLATDARMKVVYGGLAMAYLFPIIYGSDWPEVGWC
ncbi:hypothetical protein OMP38_27085 [Cohnella ginsengisoli]|uniref:Uncharacterized protein n=1 Tax=Cohnella ginsengisoli TaxID=425004 RepID=A0A9X4KQY8_9BACL|nr:hypothetical protein [Cohnella ginsengisoli]MDG0794085.1 hypothetical protein [Cohnella ginsengisoli]